ncbi:MAG: DNA-protecting protein DprA [Bifidobacteriaceae bacterium]|jgi:DNA processing protein|nr:DNA-protecting protein DprA [Bifidobacteriaceae bacterium]
MNEGFTVTRTEHDETVALLALLRAVPRGVTWADVAGEVMLAGSSASVLEKVRAEDGALLPDPARAERIGEALRRAEVEVAEWEERELSLVTVLSTDYPRHLAGVFDCPPFLFFRGSLLPDDRGMSVVGSRKASPEGLAMARRATGLLAERGLSVIAGLAEGIDTAAHLEALSLGARTVGVLGTGIARYYPASNRGLQDQIAAKGLVISQFLPDQPPTQTTFPMRNGTMSGYGLATIVVEAGEHSGSRIQARKAADHGRPVILSERVATSTQWGSAMAREPWVCVAGSDAELADAIDQVIADSRDGIVEALGLAAP